jgi:hypothetical protein
MVKERKRAGKDDGNEERNRKSRGRKRENEDKKERKRQMTAVNYYTVRSIREDK